MTPNDGKTACRECGERFMLGWVPLVARGATCGDCMERRTPLKREIARLAEQSDRYERALREILEGGRRHDMGSPLGLYASMAARLIEIAKRALQLESNDP